ncbi:MAG: hypothetical protein H7Z16_10505 [Pyrinomonadaceae bacterium]|nr:hypothetical protein [Pyrinomonadaceae bacterium]
MKSTLTQAGVAPTKLVGAAWAISVAIAAVTLGGFGMVFAVVMTLIERGLSVSEGGMVLILVSLLIILTIVGLLVRQLSRVLSIPQLSVPAPTQRPTLAETAVPQIAAAHAPVASVTDHTTRTLEPVYKERDTQRS